MNILRIERWKRDVQERCGRDKWKREVEERSGVIGDDQSSFFTAKDVCNTAQRKE